MSPKITGRYIYKANYIEGKSQELDDGSKEKNYYSSSPRYGIIQT
jgi:hypothetical protein